MNEFFSWDMLGTYVGAVTAVSLMVQFTKGLPFIKALPTQAWSYALALVTLLIALPFSSAGWTWEGAALTVFNALVVALGANGAYEAVTKLPDRMAAKPAEEKQTEKE